MDRTPYVGRLKLGSTGEPVVLLKRALRAAGLLPGKGRPTGFLGPFAVRAIVKLGQADRLPPRVKGGAWRRGLKRFSTGGVYGPRAHRKLAAYYDDYGSSRLRKITRARQLGMVQAAGVAACNLVIARRSGIHYTQGPSRMSGVRLRRRPPSFGEWEDCSSEATWILYVMDQVARSFGGRVDDPNGLGYNGQGFTGTQMTHGLPVNAFTAPLLALVFYASRGRIGHVAVKRSMTRVMNMGSESGPRDEPVGYRTPVAARAYPITLPG